MDALFGFALFFNAAIQGVDLSVELAKHTTGYPYPDPTGVLEIATPLIEREYVTLDVYWRHMSSIPSLEDNQFGGINMGGVRLTLKLRN